MYRLARRGVVRIADGLAVSRDMAEWRDYRQWLKAGGVPEPMPAVVAQPPGPAEIVAQLTRAVQVHLDATARQRGYDGILSCASYATSGNARFAAEGQACVMWRDAVWSACYAIMAEVQSGTRPVPAAPELIAELPAMVWP